MSSVGDEGPLNPLAGPYRKLSNTRYADVRIYRMTRTEFVERLVLHEICDDFENVDQIILPNVAKIGAKCGLTIQRCDVVEALRVLLEAGLAKACDLRAPGRDPFSGEIQGIPPLDVAEKDYRTYFYVTKKGLDHLERIGRGGHWMMTTKCVPTGSHQSDERRGRIFTDTPTMSGPAPGHSHCAIRRR